MAIHGYFNRDSRFYVEMSNTLWEIPILADYSFSQATEVSEITLTEAEDSTGTSVRGRAAYNDALNPVEWSVTTYMRPYTTSTPAGHALVDGVLWAAMMGADTYLPASRNFTRGGSSNVVYTHSTGIFTFGQSNRSSLGNVNLYFVLGQPGSTGDTARRVIRVNEAVVNEASITFDLDGISSVTWSGFGGVQSDIEVVRAAVDSENKLAANAAADISGGSLLLDSANTFSLRRVTNDISSGGKGTKGDIADTISEGTGTGNTGNMIRNRLTQLAVAPVKTGSFAVSQAGLEAAYLMALTGGSITINNNVTFVTPEELGVVNQPLAHVTGARQVSGEINCYMRFNDASGGNSSHNFWRDMAALTNVTQNRVGVTFDIGGTDRTRPTVTVSIPTAHVDIPTQSVEDVLSLTTTFNGLPSTIASTDEATIQVRGV